MRSLSHPAGLAVQKLVDSCSVVRWLSAGLLFTLVLGAVPGAARSTCNVIPRAVSEYRGALGAVNRPFAMPGDFVELTVRRGILHGDSTTSTVAVESRPTTSS
jgi:hypothetical protein